jgi:hypothetical protein
LNFVRITLRTYVHLMDAGVGDTDFLDQAITIGAKNQGAPPGLDP